MKKKYFLTTVILSSLSLITTNLIIPTSKAQATELTECITAPIAGGDIDVKDASSTCSIADGGTVTDPNFNFTYSNIDADLTFTIDGDLEGRLTSITTTLTGDDAQVDTFTNKFNATFTTATGNIDSISLFANTTIGAGVTPDDTADVASDITFTDSSVKIGTITSPVGSLDLTFDNIVSPTVESINTVGEIKVGGVEFNLTLTDHTTTIAATGIHAGKVSLVVDTITSDATKNLITLSGNSSLTIKNGISLSHSSTTANLSLTGAEGVLNSSTEDDQADRWPATYAMYTQTGGFATGLNIEADYAKISFTNTEITDIAFGSSAQDISNSSVTITDSSYTRYNSTPSAEPTFATPSAEPTFATPTAYFNATTVAFTNFINYIQYSQIDLTDSSLVISGDIGNDPFDKEATTGNLIKLSSTQNKSSSVEFVGLGNSTTAKDLSGINIIVASVSKGEDYIKFTNSYVLITDLNNDVPTNAVATAGMNLVNSTLTLKDSNYVAATKTAASTDGNTYSFSSGLSLTNSTIIFDGLKDGSNTVSAVNIIGDLTLTGNSQILYGSSSDQDTLVSVTGDMNLSEGIFVFTNKHLYAVPGAVNITNSNVQFLGGDDADGAVNYGDIDTLYSLSGSLSLEGSTVYVQGAVEAVATAETVSLKDSTLTVDLGFYAKDTVIIDNSNLIIGDAINKATTDNNGANIVDIATFSKGFTATGNSTITTYIAVEYQTTDDNGLLFGEALPQNPADELLTTKVVWNLYDDLIIKGTTVSGDNKLILGYNATMNIYFEGFGKDFTSLTNYGVLNIYTDPQELTWTAAVTNSGLINIGQTSLTVSGDYTETRATASRSAKPVGVNYGLDLKVNNTLNNTDPSGEIIVSSGGTFTMTNSIIWVDTTSDVNGQTQSGDNALITNDSNNDADAVNVEGSKVVFYGDLRYEATLVVDETGNVGYTLTERQSLQTDSSLSSNSSCSYEENFNGFIDETLLGNNSDAFSDEAKKELALGLNSNSSTTVDDFQATQNIDRIKTVKSISDAMNKLVFSRNAMLQGVNSGNTQVSSNGKMNVWYGLSYLGGSQSTECNTSKQKVSSFNNMIGFDMQGVYNNHDYFVGAVVGYAAGSGKTETTDVTTGGSLNRYESNLDLFDFGIYGGYNFGNQYVFATMQDMIISNDLSRGINITDVYNIADASSTDNIFMFNVEYGYKIPQKVATIIPYARFDFVNYSMGGYTESGVNTSVNVDSMSHAEYSFTVGSYLNFNTSIQGLNPYLNVILGYTVADETETSYHFNQAMATSTFSNNYLMTDDSQDPLKFNLGMGTTYAIDTKFDLRGSYDFSVSGKNTMDHNVSLKVSYKLN